MSLNRSTNAIRLDPRRVEQIKLIAAKEGRTSAGVIAEIIREKIAAGVIPAALPGISVTRDKDTVHIQIDDAPVATYTRDVAIQIGNALASVADGKAGTVSIDHNYAVVRQGTGIKVSLPFSGANALPFKLAPSFPPDLAKDFAEMILQAAK